jgi:hypothetical protein
MNRWEEKDLKCGRTAHEFTMTMRWHKTHCLSRRFWHSTRSLLERPSTLLTSPSPMRLFFISKDQACIKRNPFWVHRCSAGQSNWGMKLSEKNLQHCFEQRKICMELCRGWGGDHFEGDKISSVWSVEWGPLWRRQHFQCVISWITDFRTLVRLLYNQPTH